jgi:hypothetical protein
LAVYEHRDPATWMLGFGNVVRSAGMGTGSARVTVHAIHAGAFAHATYDEVK